MISYLDFEMLVKINKDVVSLTKELHEYTERDSEKLRSILRDVRSKGKNAELREAITQKVSALIYGIASGQPFHEGNKRTALVASLAFLEMNGFTMDIRNPELVSLLDRAGIGLTSLNDAYSVCLLYTSPSPRD